MTGWVWGTAIPAGCGDSRDRAAPDPSALPQAALAVESSWQGGTVPSGSLGLGVPATGPPDRGDSPRNAQRGFGAVPWDPRRLWEGFGGGRNHPAVPPRSSHPLAAVAELSLPK